MILHIKHKRRSVANEEETLQLRKAICELVIVIHNENPNHYYVMGDRDRVTFALRDSAWEVRLATR